jgi:hypothetical protein
LRTRLAIAALLALTLGRPAGAAEALLAWDDCRGGRGESLRSFACNSDGGSQTLVVSVTAPPGMGMWTGFEIITLFDFGTSTRPAWWELRNGPSLPGSCRNGTVSVNVASEGLTGCEDPYQGIGMGGIGSYYPVGGNSRTALKTVFAVPMGSEAPLTANREYFVQKIVITNAHTSSCGGCAVPVCISIESVKVGQPYRAPGGDVIVVPQDRGSVSWQAAGTCGASRSKRTSWSNVKSIYR